MKRIISIVFVAGILACAMQLEILARGGGGGGGGGRGGGGGGASAARSGGGFSPSASGSRPSGAARVPGPAQGVARRLLRGLQARPRAQGRGPPRRRISRASRRSRTAIGCCRRCGKKRCREPPVHRSAKQFPRRSGVRDWRSGGNGRGTNWRRSGRFPAKRRATGRGRSCRRSCRRCGGRPRASRRRSARYAWGESVAKSPRAHRESRRAAG